MTTFNELLGTSTDEPLEIAKKRYKLLSLKVHPDKGGTQLLMQLVRHAYENVKAGRGHHKLTLPREVTVADNQALAQMLALLKQENTLLRNQVQQLENKAKSQNNLKRLEEFQLKSFQFERKSQQLEKQITLLRDERRKLLYEKEKEKEQKLKLAKELKRILLENELRDSEVKRGKKTLTDKAPISYIALIISLLCLFLLMLQTFLS